MPWVPLDDKFHLNPKVLAAGNAAAGLYARFLAYCSDQLTDGFISDAIANMYGTRRELAALVAVVPPNETALCEKVDGGYVIPDYLDFNASREEVLAARSDKHMKRVEAGTLGGIASGIARRKQHRSNGEATSEATDDDCSKQTGSKTKPHPIPSLLTESRAEFESFWEHYPRKEAKKAAEKAFVKARREVSLEQLVTALDPLKRKAANPADRQYIPHAATWLNAGRWEDQPETAGPTSTTMNGVSVDHFTAGRM